MDAREKELEVFPRKRGERQFWQWTTDGGVPIVGEKDRCGRVGTESGFRYVELHRWA